MQKSNQKMERLSYALDFQESAAADDNEADVDKLIKFVAKDHQKGTLVDVSFTMWDVNRIIKFPNFFIKQLSSLQYNSSRLLTTTSRMMNSLDRP